MSSSSPAPAGNGSTFLNIAAWPQNGGIVFNNNGDRLCGIRNLAPGLLDSCCTSGSRRVLMNHGAQYCSTDMKLTDFARCVVGSKRAGNSTTIGSRSSSTINMMDIFCESHISGDAIIANHETDSSAAFHNAHTPRTSYLLIAVLLFSVFFSSATATIISSLSTDKIARRDDDRFTNPSCSLSVSSTYIKTNPNPIPISPKLTCTGPAPCAFMQHIDTGLANNNRTLNGTSAAEPKYDYFFDFIALKSKRGFGFPAQSSITLDYEFFAAMPQFRLGFQAVSWCLKGEVTGCKGSVFESDGVVPVEVCGPLWVQESGAGEEPGVYPGFTTGSSAGVQGIFAPMKV